MPANNPKPAATTPASPRSTAKYTNKDGSKFITVPKESHSDSSLPPTPTGAKASDSPASEVIALENAPRTINRKKQKRRQKAAAKAAAVETNGNDHEDLASAEHRTESPYPGREVLGSDDDLEYVLASEQSVPSVNGQTNTTSKSKKNKKKKKKNIGNESSGVDAPSHPTLPQGARSGMSRDKIWSNSNHEERERIKDFWLGLGEEERKSLVKVEKDAVLRKMKEQQKHTCSCTVCGRKRNAIEEELEGLYDAYYLELEQFANQGEGPPMLPPPRDFPLRPARGIPSGYTAPPPTRGRLVEQIGDEDEDDLEEVYSEDEVDDDEFSDDEPPESYHNSHDRDVADFLTFGNSLQVKGGILTVADDLLKNDGKRFIEMMEQLAERRMAREEDAREHFSRGYGHPDGSYSNSHNHPPPEEDEYDEEEDEEDDYDDSQDEEYEDEEDQMTEEQRMEEGRRMFQIFAARMFEQRVLSAYKEKVAKERQQKLLEELEEESRQVDEQKAKKAKSAQKKKDKAAQRKQALAEEKARKEAEKAAEEAARLEAEQKRVAEQKQKAEEKRKQREAQKKAEEDARLRKEAERLRKLHEQKERQAEQERKARESKEREKKLKEEQRQKEKEVRDQKEREAHERREKQERDKREKEARAVKAQKDALEATEAKVKAKEEKNVQKPAASQISIPPGQRASHTSTALPQHLPTPLSYASPKIPIATPAVNKVPTPIRHRATSQQDQMRSSSTTSQSAIGVSPNPSPHSSTPIHTSPGNIGQERKTSLGTISSGLLSSQSVSPPGLPTVLPNQAPPFHMPAMVSSGHLHHPPPGFQNRLPQDQMYPVPFRPNPNIMMGPPGINGQTMRGLPPGPMAPPGFSHGASDPFPLAQGFAIPKDVPQPTHARHGSGSFEVNGSVGLPIGRPAPIGRPSNNVQGSTRHEDSETKPLGSSALVADDEPLTGDLGTNSYRGPPPGLPRGGFGTSPFMDNGFPMVPGPWGAPAGAQQFAPASFGSTSWGGPSVPPGFGVTSPAPSLNPLRTASQPRHIAVRLMLCQACKDLSNAGNADVEGFMGLGAIKSQIDMHSGDPTITEQDLLNLCDTEGNGSNGGGTFDVRGSPDTGGKPVIRWVPDGNDGHVPQYRAVGAPGEIGSPLTGFTSMRGI